MRNTTVSLRRPINQTLEKESIHRTLKINEIGLALALVLDCKDEGEDEDDFPTEGSFYFSYLHE